MREKGRPRMIFRASGRDLQILREMAKLRNCTISDLMREGLQQVFIKYRYQYQEAVEALKDKK